jgi:hypothetical protein
MRYLKLYEAFSSNTLSKLYMHLKKKNASKKSLNQFKEDIEVMAKSFDIPMDKISDEDVSYVSRKKALPLREDAKNDSGIWAIKFWFDRDGEYIGTSGTGNATFEFSTPSKSGSQSMPYSKAQWDKIKKSLTYGFPKTGYLIPVLSDEYGDLEAGDDVIAVLCDGDDYEDYASIDNLLYGKIFVDNDGELYIMHDNGNADGMSPNDSPSEEYPDIEWGGYSWRIADGGKRPNSDHYNLHRVVESPNPLGYYSDKKEDADVAVDPFSFNLSLEEIEDGKLALSSWSGNTEEKIRIEKEADFAVILYIDGILGRGLKSKAATSDERKEARKGAVALMSDEEFKQANIEKYLNQAISKIGVTPESAELKSLEKVVATIMCSGIGESYSLLSMIERDFRSIDNFAYQIKRLISTFTIENADNTYALKFIYGEFLNEYKILKRRSSNSYKCKKVAMDILKGKEELKPLYDSIMRISAKISKGIISKEITRGEDLKKIFFKLDSIDSAMRDDEFRISSELRDFVDSIRYAATDTSSTERKINTMMEDYYKTSILDKDLKSLKEIESYVEDIFGI